MKYCLDTSMLFDLWLEHYRPNIFPSLYTQLIKLSAHFIIIKPIFNEIQEDAKTKKEQPSEGQKLREWIQSEAKIEITEPGHEVDEKTFELKAKYEYEENSKGAGEVDLTLIAYAKIHKCAVVTSESRQEKIPLEKKNYKIPLICQQEGVACFTPIEFLEKIEISV